MAKKKKGKKDKKGKKGKKDKGGLPDNEAKLSRFHKKDVTVRALSRARKALAKAERLTKALIEAM